MSKFKVGNMVRRTTSAHGGMRKGDAGEVTAIHPEHGFLSIKGFDPDPEIFHDPRYFELVTPAETLPVRTVSRQEIVEGVYGCVEVSNRYGYNTSKRIGILIANHGDVHRDMGAAELRAAARVLVSLAEALEQDGE